ncbi:MULTISPECIES: hypothetical protein [Klebsiella]|uniref:hypothetical protein n=1 Tax=Klebsiella TaxID=570 RepID=UPI000B40C3DA|nr:MULTISPECIES: hypothetical protein [Klebsiella]MBQ5273180.1 hypothetical protein [Klebsiella quasipneumoniae]MCC5458854.1 hypothetical protein [Klebsiella quasipneumoniae subsp. similipneumoniae]MCJ1816928.1 hypothetical protein [Klebsiella quasipneumoniae subsp. similipneumoniae]MCM8544235.1 hypothetical protein [Klebsiella quasipneumoniae]MCS4373335.1 hypothetical protein [Klebsiella quasipneumoniae subsp. similipneumoniae]
MPLLSPFSGRLFPHSRGKFSKNFFSARCASRDDRRLRQRKKSAPARIFTVSSAKTFHKETK